MDIFEQESTTQATWMDPIWFDSYSILFSGSGWILSGSLG